MTVETLLAEHAVGVSEFKRNPAQSLADAGNEPVVVLAHNKPVGYFVSPAMFASMRDAIEMIEDIRDAELAEKRWNEQRTRAVTVDIDELGKI